MTNKLEIWSSAPELTMAGSVILVLLVEVKNSRGCTEYICNALIYC